MRCALFAATLTLCATPALACSCAPVNASTPKPDILLSATVVGVAAVPATGEAVTTLRVASHFIGKTPKTIRIRARTSSAACGVVFEPGKRQMFALARAGKGYTTNSCLMLRAKL